MFSKIPWIVIVCIVSFLLGLWFVQPFKYVYFFLLHSSDSSKTNTTLVETQEKNTLDSGEKTVEENDKPGETPAVNPSDNEANKSDAEASGDKPQGNADGKSAETEKPTEKKTDKPANEIVPSVTPVKVEPVKPQPVPSITQPVTPVPTVSKGKAEAPKSGDTSTTKENPMLKVLDKLAQ